MNGFTLIADPILPWPVVWTLASAAVLFVLFGLWRGLRGGWLRALGAAALIAALVQPALMREERRPLSDIVLMVVDETASQGLGERRAQTEAAARRIEAEIAALPNTELRRITVRDDAENAGSLLMTALTQALSEEPRARVAGAIILSDGQVHDLTATPQMPAPMHLVLTGREADWDRRLTVTQAPAFGIIGEPLTLTLRIDELGAIPAAEAGRTVEMTIAVDGQSPQAYDVPVNEDLELPVTLGHGGQNVVELGLTPSDGELTERNNYAVVQINGVRDRLRVLLVSGEPHAGERTWRNLLKSDSSVDLVHFTILRPPEKQDGVPVDELSLIAFPTRELFVDKINEFDLIIFDRYKLRGILPAAYLDNIRDYVLNGGAVLVSAGPDYASVESVYYSSLGEIMPGAPSGIVVEEGFKPTVTDIGHRHPVTEGLQASAAALNAADESGAAPGAAGSEAAQSDEPAWGRWLRIVDLVDPRGQIVMEGAGGRPLLLLDRAGEGRVALLASDQAWLWSRGFEGGGPQLELLRRLAHWLMKEPQLEEEALDVAARDLTMTITRRTLEEAVAPLTVTGPDGTETVLTLTEGGPGKFIATWTAPDIGLYRLSDGTIERVFALGPASPREFEAPIASAEPLAPALEATNGGSVRIEDQLPDIRTVREGRPAVGRGWIGITPRGAYQTADIRVLPLMPAWAFLLLTSLLAVVAWLREGRR